MATQVQWRGGSTAEHATFTGAAREVTVDTQKKTLVVHDGSTAGGEPLLREDQANLPTSVTNGISVPSTNNVAISTAGTGRLFVNSSGQVGIGGSPAYMLDITTGGFNDIARFVGYNAGTLLFRNSSTDLCEIRAEAGDSLAIGAGGAERLRITADGKLGVGTSTPAERLDLGGGVSDTVKLRFSMGGNVGTIGSVGSGVADGRGNLTFFTRNGATEVAAMTIDGYQRVGVGTTSPGESLSLTEGTALGWNDTSGNNAARIYATSGDELRFERGSTNSRSMTIDSSGRLLVGTSSSTTVSVNGYTGKTQIASSENAALALHGHSSGAPYGADIVFTRSRSATIGTNTIVQNGDQISRILFAGANGTGYDLAASIGADIDGTPGASGDMPGRLVFSTTADGASSPTTRMTLFSNGSIRAVETAGAYFYPGIDNSIYLGSPSFRYNLVYSVNGTASSSDEREKTEINDAALGIDFIKSLRPVSYKWKVGHNDVEAGDEGDVVIPRPGLRTHWGFLAQDVKQAADQAGVDFGGWILTDVDNPESPQGLRYQQFIAPLTKALQEAIAKIETLEAKVAALEAS